MKNRTFVVCLLGIVLIGIGAGTVVFIKSGAELDDVVTVFKQQVHPYDYSWQKECDDRCAEYIGSTAMAELDGAGCQQLAAQLELAKMFGEVDETSMKAIRDKMESLPDCGVKVRSYNWQKLCDATCARQVGEQKMQWLNLATCAYLEIEVDNLKKQGVSRTEPIAKAIYDKAQFAKCQTWL